MSTFQRSALSAGYGVSPSIEEGRFRWVSSTLSVSHRTYASEEAAWEACCRENKL